MKLNLNEMMRVAVQAAAADAIGEKERAERDDIVIAKWRERLPGVPLYKTHIDDHLLVFRPPTSDAWESSKVFEARGISALQMVQEFVGACLLHPSQEKLQEHAEHRPALMGKLAEQCFKIAGVDSGLDFKRAR